MAGKNDALGPAQIAPALSSQLSESSLLERRNRPKLSIKIAKPPGFIIASAVAEGENNSAIGNSASGINTPHQPDLGSARAREDWDRPASADSSASSGSLSWSLSPRGEPSPLHLFLDGWWPHEYRLFTTRYYTGGEPHPAHSPSEYPRATEDTHTNTSSSIADGITDEVPREGPPAENKPRQDDNSEDSAEAFASKGHRISISNQETSPCSRTNTASNTEHN